MFELTRVVICGHVPLAAHDVIDVLAVAWCIFARLAGSDTELCGRNEILSRDRGDKRVETTSIKIGKYMYRPFMNLLKFTKCIGKDEATDRVTCMHTISSDTSAGD